MSEKLQLRVEAYDMLGRWCGQPATEADLAAAGYIPVSQLADVTAEYEKAERLWKSATVEREDAKADAERGWNEVHGLQNELGVVVRKLADVTAKLEAAEGRVVELELSAKNWKRNWEIASTHEVQLEAKLRRLNDAAADLVAEAVGPYDPPQRGSNLERLYRLVSVPEVANVDGPSDAEAREFRAKFSMNEPASPPSPALTREALASSRLDGETYCLDETEPAQAELRPWPSSVAERNDAERCSRCKLSWVLHGAPCSPWCAAHKYVAPTKLERHPNLDAAPQRPPAEPAQAEPELTSDEAIKQLCECIEAAGGKLTFDPSRGPGGRCNPRFCMKLDCPRRAEPQPPAAPGTPLTVELMVEALRDAADAMCDSSEERLRRLADELERAQKGVDG